MVRARVITLVLLAAGLFATPHVAWAQDVEPARLNLSSITGSTAVFRGSSLTNVKVGELEQMSPIVPRRPVFGGGKKLLTSLYASTAVMQALDIHSTLRAFSAGAVEGNPLMSGVTRNRAAFVATKAAVTAVTVFAVNKIAKKNKVAAVITLIAVNSAYAMVVQHNYRLARNR
jgi:hypothetical protein